MQPIIRAFCASTLAVAASLSFADAPMDGPQNTRAGWHAAIQSGYDLLAEETTQLAEHASSYCTAPDEQLRAQLEQHWRDAFMAWQQVRFVDFGPVENNNLAWQFQFWPDPKNLVARKAGYLTNSDQPITADLIEQSGVAVQGFPMLEYLLFDEALSNSKNALPAPHSCALLTTVTRHIAENSKQLSDDWHSFKTPYLNTEAYQVSTLKSAMAALEILEEKRLAKPMGLRGNGKRNPYITDAWRSGTSALSVEATLRGLQQHFLPEFLKLLEQKGEAPLAQRIQRQFEAALDNFPGADRPMATLLSDDNAFRTLQGLYVDVSQLTTLFNDQAAVALGVVRGFNSSDGD
ncbi:imelysin family protein [Marinobacter litoralis]|uniref:imelysin family protein n=1 Tax=Marinobacter litoralis TaxID=187981 RepID=UPI0018EC3F08|nr:imelysin family protein [Marinobacter litoralis]MBJ6137160.1 imelysin family protein [Marinobacter litoralis]